MSTLVRSHDWAATGGLVTGINRAAESFDLRLFFLSRVDLSYVEMSRHDFTGKTLRHCNLTGARFISCNFKNTTFENCNLRGAHFESCIMDGVRFDGGDLGQVEIDDCEITDAYFYAANLAFVTLVDCRGERATIERCLTYHMEIIRSDDAQRLDLRVKDYLSVPEAGAFTAYKKVAMIRRRRPGGGRDVGPQIVAQLEIPADAQRLSTPVGRKCRASAARVVEFFNVNREPLPRAIQAMSNHDNDFIYKRGELVVPTKPFDADPWAECRPGIHFFLTFDEAANY